MKTIKNHSKIIGISLLSCLGLGSCTPKQELPMSHHEMLKTVQDCGRQFSIGVQKKDSAALVNIYSDSARYVQPNRKILVGKEEIGKDWAGFLRIKEEPIDLILEINNVGGTRDIIYETGTGYTLLADSSKWRFNYVNVWRRHSDGSYKLEVDTYTPMD